VGVCGIRFVALIIIIPSPKYWDQKGLGTRQPHPLFGTLDIRCTSLHGSIIINYGNCMADVKLRFLFRVYFRILHKTGQVGGGGYKSKKEHPHIRYRETQFLVGGGVVGGKSPPKINPALDTLCS
jgi:hypothetical protein